MNKRIVIASSFSELWPFVNAKYKTFRENFKTVSLQKLEGLELVCIKWSSIQLVQPTNQGKNWLWPGGWLTW